MTTIHQYDSVPSHGCKDVFMEIDQEPTGIYHKSNLHVFAALDIVNSFFLAHAIQQTALQY